MKTLFKMKWMVMALVIVALIFTVGACGKDEIVPETSDIGSGLDDTNHTTDAAFKVRNNSSARLVAFKGAINTRYVMGVIPKNAQNHGLGKKNPNGENLFNSATSEAFPLILIKEEDYRADNTYLATLEQNPFTRVYVFYNANGDNNVVYDISSRLGGDKKIVISNPSDTLNVEIRLGGINGETIGYAPGGMRITNLYVTVGEYDVFPVFKRYNPLRDIVETIYPKAQNGDAWARSLVLDTADVDYFYVKDAIDALSTVTAGMAILRVDNQSRDAVHLIMDNVPVKSPTGIAYFRGIRDFPVDLSIPGTKGSFQPQKTIVCSVGPNAKEISVKTTDNSTQLILKADKLYTVTVTGDQNTSFTAVVELNEEAENGIGPTAIEFDWL